MVNSYIIKNLKKDKELILARVLNKSRSFILAYPEYKLSKKEQDSFNKLIHRRLQGEPLAYVLGEQEFYGLPFKVNKNVLIPRPETELITQHITHNTQRNSIVIDVGTGSGALAISIARIKNEELKIKNTKIIAIDISSKALAVAKQNAKLNKVEKQITFLKGNLLEPLLSSRGAPRDPSKIRRYNKLEAIPHSVRNDKIIIVANLPYLKTGLPGLTKQQKHDLSFEPRLALLAGADGLKYYRQLAKQIITLKKLHPKLSIELLAEIDPDQVKPMKKLFSFAKIVVIKKDFRNLNRLCIITI